MASDPKVPRKYWWVVVVALPVVLALIAIVPSLFKSSGGSGGSGGGTTVNVPGTGNTINFGYITNNTFVTNVNVIADEYKLQTGLSLSDDLRKQIEAAVNAANQNNHAESIRLFEQVAQAAPVPAILNNLGVEYKQAKNEDASRKAFELSKERAAELTKAAAASRPLPTNALTAPAVSGAAIKTESSAIPAMTIDAVTDPYEAPGEIHVIAHGTPLTGSYSVKYQPKPGVTVAMDPGAYDVLLKVTGFGAGFVLASNVIVREGTLTRINPNALVGGIAVEPVSKPGFPAFKKLEVVDRMTDPKQPKLAQETVKLGVTLPIAPGTYDVFGTTTDGHQVQLADDLTVKVGAITRLDPIGQVAAIVVRKPNIAGLDMQYVYALNAGTTQIVAQVEAWDMPMLVPAGRSYDIALKQAAGLTKIKLGMTPGRGELVEIKPGG